MIVDLSEILDFDQFLNIAFLTCVWIASIKIVF